MTVRKSMLGLTVVCALMFSAFAAANASAAGTTTFTCVPNVGGTLGTDCIPGTSGTSKPVEVTPGSTTTTTSASTTNQTLNGVIAGIPIEIVCTADTATGMGTQNAGPPMNVTGTETIIKYTGCTVTKPVGKSCVVKGGAITTNKLKLSTSLTTSPAGVKFEPETGTEFVAITFEKCTTSTLNGTFPVKGSEIAIPKGALLETTTTSGSLTFAGNAATLVGTNTVKGPANPLILQETSS